MNLLHRSLFVLSFSVLFPCLTGIDACQQTEVCDGVDNDNDGEIDEGFDQDLDGWTTCAGDCDDLDDSVFPGAAEVSDGYDNDCDGMVDEATTPLFRFVNYDTGAPLVGIPMWLGTDGSGPLFYSDASGEVQLPASDGPITLSFGWIADYYYEGGHTSERNILSEQGTIPADITEWWLSTQYDTTSADITLEGTVSGIQSEAGSRLRVQVGDERSYHARDVSAEGLTSYDFSLFNESISYLFTTQHAESTSIPTLYNLVSHPESPADVSLDYRWDRPYSFRLSGIDPHMTTLQGYETIWTGEGTRVGTLYDAKYTIASGSNLLTMNAPALEGPMADGRVDLYAKVFSDDQKARQYARVYWPGQSGSSNVTFAPVPEVGAYPTIDASNVSGLRLDITNDGGADYEYAQYMDSLRNESGDEGISHSWSTVNYDYSQPVVFPAIPEGAFEWPAAGSQELIAEYTYGSVVVFSPYVGEVRTYSQRELETAPLSGSAQRAQSRSAARESALRDLGHRLPAQRLETLDQTR